MDELFEFIGKNEAQYIELLRIFCNQPSVSARNEGMKEMAEIVVKNLEKLSAKVQVIDTPGYPIVYGEIDSGCKRTLTFYNHYDVQPPEPIEEWATEPFRLTERDGRLYARGVADNKGSLLSRLCAVDACEKIYNRLPVNVKFIVEGEEETGSPNLSVLAREHPEKLKTDGLIWEGGSRFVGGPLQIALGVKGLCYVELNVTTAKSEMHSQYAPIVSNPAWRLVQALSTMKDVEGNITIDGFYDEVKAPDVQEEEFLANMYFDEEAIKESLGIACFTGKSGGLGVRRRFFTMPTCNICGFTSGYGGRGIKTVVPARASVKMDFRLVYDQKPQRIAMLLREHLDRRGFDDVEINMLSAKYPYRTASDSPIVKSVIECAERVYGMKPAVYMNLAGTTAIYDLCHDTGIQAVLFGVCNDDSRIHAPNENIFVSDYINGIRLTADVMRRFGEM